MKRDVVEAVPAQPFDLQQRRLVGRGLVLRREGRLERAPDDHGEEVVVRDVRDGGRPAHLAVAQDGDPVGDLANLGQPVGDVDDGRSASAASLRTAVNSSSTESCESGAVGSSRIRSRGETANALASSSRWRRATLSDDTRSSRWPREVDVVEQRAHRLRRVGIAAPQMLEPDGHADVLGDRHVGQQRRMLVDDRDPEVLRDRRREVVDRLAVETIVPLSGGVAPDATFISVDLPAPFSPSRACTSPGSTSNETSVSAAIAA